jgi:hypothetical protein
MVKFSTFEVIISLLDPIDCMVHFTNSSKEMSVESLGYILRLPLLAHKVWRAVVALRRNAVAQPIGNQWLRRDARLLEVHGLGVLFDQTFGCLKSNTQNKLFMKL